MFAHEIIRELLDSEILDANQSNQVVIDTLVDYKENSECDYSVGMLYEVFCNIR